MKETMKPWREPAIVAAPCIARIKKLAEARPYIIIFGLGLAAIALVIAFWAYLHATPDSVNGDGEEVAPICEGVMK